MKYIATYWVLGEEGSSRIEKYRFNAKDDRMARKIAKGKMEELWQKDGTNHVDMRGLERITQIRI
ncbi:MAG: hypothetical protein N3D20_03065 [Candidatus Pacearchaeota archaeon]|nr:hypothetical protein [Candidatus Pacearchaeota archaeon]